MDYINIKIEQKQDNADDNGEIVGYGAVYGVVDRGQDMIVAGAFANSLKENRSIKMLFQHNPSDVIGVWTDVVEDDSGLMVIGKLADTPRGQEIRELLKMKAVDGLSIGYRTKQSHYNADGVRVITEAELWEVSVVTFPMNESAGVTSVKQYDELSALLKERLTLLGAF